VQDPPRIPELIEAVREFLERDALPELRGRTRFLARVSVNVLGLVLRELELAPAAEAAERERLAELLGRPVPDLDEGNRELCRRIREREIGLADEALRAHLWQTTLAKLAVDQPRYSGCLAARERLHGGRGGAA